MPTLKDALEAHENHKYNLDRAFNEIAKQVKTHHPEFWDKAVELMDDNESSLTHWLMANRHELNGQRGVDLLDAKGQNNEQDILNAISAYGDYFCA